MMYVYFARKEGWIVVLKYFCCGLHQFYSNCYALSPLLAPSYKLFTPRCSTVTL